MKGRFFIKAKEPNVVTEKGVRAFVLERLLNSPFAKGTAFNVDEKTVEIWIEGDEQQIKKFKEQLEKDVIAKFGNPVITFTEFKQDHLLEVPDLMRSSQALLVGQLEKGITVQLKILGKLDKLDKLDILDELKSELKSLPREIAKALKEA